MKIDVNHLFSVITGLRKEIKSLGKLLERHTESRFG